MVFVPKRKEKPAMGSWKLDSSLPQTEFQFDGRINLTELARAVSERLPVKSFSDRVQYNDIVDKAFSQAWPQWEEYFSPLVRESFQRDVRRAVFRYANIEIKSEKNDNRSNSKPVRKANGETTGGRGT